ncbi:putative signal-transduction protein containing cAMP-binding and CBS domains [Xenococcus sp. PCC 7305]|uniref:CBS domain-containing protein n=1 Tax=Xenococcus sp. PCC 7305 TaxID=102125 RepID=UPI0002ACF7B5|nr:CBS domain-containing protein [Xenococcus sp. PCC 7305]ELS00767.1 putative signal-transduction protein containing cAMP-binding and CBS domains [Xenococcus sp. PCC 7305]
MKVADIMTTNIVTIDSLATIAEAAKMMEQHNIKALIVDRTSDQDAYGIITATDISQAVANAKNPQETYVCELMTKPCIVVNPDLAVEHIPKLFARAKIRTAPVIRDRLLGIVSLTDILGRTDCLTPIKPTLTSQKLEELAELYPCELTENKWEIGSESIYENWCSG